MIKHFVCFKLTESSLKEKNYVKDLLLSMWGNVPSVKAIEVGSDILSSSRSYDIALSVTLDDLTALDAYQHDAYHCGIVKEYIHAHTISSIAVDYELD